MKVVQVTTSSKGGAGIAALRLHKALRAAGISSAFLSKDLSINFEGKTVKDTFFDYKKPSFFSKVKRKLGLWFSPSKQDQIRQVISKVNDQLSYEILSLPFSSYALENHPLVQQADLVHLHWVGGLVDYNTFFSEINKPIVWTLHDMNPFLGMFHYAEDETLNETYLSQVEKQVKLIKKDAIHKINTGALITPSQWLLDESNKKDVFQKFQIKETIANAIDLESFKLMGKASLRKSISIAPDAFVLLFTAGNLKNHRKGADLLRSALELLNIPVTLLTVGHGELNIKNPNVVVRPLGFVKSSEEMAGYYALSDAFVLSSREDNLPNTMLESFACGTPVISFAVGGMKEYIEDGDTGYLSVEMNSESLSKYIEKFYHTRSSFDSKKIRKFAEEHFHPTKQAEKYQKVYLGLLKATTPNQ